MSRLADKFAVMKRMNRDELKEYLKTMTDNDKDMLLISFIKMYQSAVENNIFERIFEQNINFNCKKQY